jgi:hypothetical protein
MLPQDKMRNSTEVASVDIDAKKCVGAVCVSARC